MNFTIFYGIGLNLSKKIELKLITKNLFTREQINNATKSQLRKILLTPIIFKELPKITQADVKYNPTKKIPRQIIDIVNNECKTYIKKNKFIIVGSYLRGSLFSSDIDLILVRKNELTSTMFNNFKESLTKSKLITIGNPIHSGEGKYVVFITIKNMKHRMLKSIYTVKMDIFITNKREYPFMLLYGTGGQKFNIFMRYIANNKG